MRQPTPIHWVVQACLLWLTLLSPFTLTWAIATPTSVSLTTRDDDKTTDSQDERFLLKVLPLGASITLGYKSTDGNGYREWIRQQLRYEGWPVEMVGTRRMGTMRDNVRPRVPRTSPLPSVKQGDQLKRVLNTD